MNLYWRNSAAESSFVRARICCHTRRLIKNWGFAVWLIANSVSATEFETYEFDISAQAADRALIEFAAQTDQTLLFSYQDTRDITTKNVHGTLPAKEALRIMLEGTGLAFSITGTGDLRVTRRNQSKVEATMNKKTLASQIATALSALILGNSTSAQQDQGSPAGRVLEEVIVTATRRATSAQDIPLSISAFSEDFLAAQGVEGFEGVARQSPGVIMTGGSGFGRFVVRGIQTSSTSSSNGEQRQVAVYYDDLPVTSFSVVTPNLRLFDIERVEVLRGPQGTSFGSGSLSGAVRVITNKADTTGFDSAFRADIGSIDKGGMRQRYSGMLNMPVADNLAVRLVAYHRDEEGHIDNEGTFGRTPVKDENTSEEWGARASLVWNTSEKFKVTLSHNIDRQDFLSGAATQNPDLGEFKKATFFSEPLIVDVDITNVTLEYDLGWATAVLSNNWASQNTSWDVDLDAIFGGLLPFGYGESIDSDITIHELRLVSNTENSLSWTAGLYSFDLEASARGALFFGDGALELFGVDMSQIPQFRQPGPTFETVFRDTINTEEAVYGELNWAFTDALSLTVGARYTQYEFSSNDSGNFATNALDLAFTGGGVASTIPLAPIPTSTGDQNEVTMKYSVQWAASDDAMIYLSAAEGFRRSHPNVVRQTALEAGSPSFIPPVADADSLWSYELGYKGVLLEGALAVNAAVYFIQWDDAQISASRQADGAPFVTNGGDIEAMGLEVDVRYLASTRLELGGALTLADSEVTRIDANDALASGLARGATLVSPDIKVSGYAQYQLWQQADASINVRTDVQYIGDYLNGPENIPGVGLANPRFAKTDAVTNVSAQIGYETQHWGVYLYGENLLSDDGRLWRSPDPTSNNNIITLTPMTVGVRVDYQL